MSNSTLVNYTKISPHRTSPRKQKISCIVIHHMAGNLSVETCGNVFQNREASSHYGIGSDGRVGMYCEEKDRAWTTGNQIDHQAVTIEVADDVQGGNWHSSDKAMEKLVLLCADICRRNGIAKLNYTGDKTGNLLMHRWYQSTDCPGAFLASKFPWIALEVNKLLANNVVNASIQDNSGANCTRMIFEEHGEFFKIKDKEHGYYLTASANAKDALVEFCKTDRGELQLWKLIKKQYKNADYTMLECKGAPELFLSVENNGIGSSELKLWTDLHNQKQKFYIREESDGTTLIIHTFTGKVVSCK